MGQPGHLILLLDTKAPELTWGSYSGVVAGEEFIILYTVDEPLVDSATIELPDGRVLPLNVTSNSLSITLPTEATEGLAIIRAHVRDEVGNTGTRTLTFLLVPKVPGVLYEISPGKFEFGESIGKLRAGAVRYFEYANLLGSNTSLDTGAIEFSRSPGVKIDSVPMQEGSLTLPGTLIFDSNPGHVTTTGPPGTYTEYN